MSTQVTLQANATGVARASYPSQSYTPGSEYTILNQNDRIFFTFTPPDNTYKYNVIEQVVFGAYSTGSAVQLKLSGVKTSFVPSSVTYNSSPDVDTLHTDTINISSSPSEHTISNRYSFNEAWAMMVKNGLRAVPYSSTYVGRDVYTSSAASKPYLKVTFSDTKVHLTPAGNPSSGYVDPRANITLSWSNARAPAYDPAIAEPEQLIAIVTWKESGDDTTHQLSVSSDTSVTIAADTWDLNKSYLWKVDVTDDGGTTTSSGWYTLSTTETSATPPTIIEPDGGTLDGSEPIIFRWTDNGRGTYKGTDISISDDNGTSWGDPVFVAEGLTSYTMPANTLTSGLKLWRARSYNAAMTAGSWSDPLPFTVIAPPAAPYYEVTTSPRPTITWQSYEQQAFQVQMGGYDSGLVFGTAQSFQCPVYLPDGPSTVRVRVMNQYNLWSEWSGTQITIANSPGTAPVLTITAGADAQLSWTDVGASRYLIYRDGELIGETDGLSFTDRYAIGQASYFVRAAEALTTQTIALTDDYYINTNSPSGYVKIDSPTAAADIWSYAQVACVEGDRFLVTATGSNSYHLAYTFAMADKSKVAPTASANTGYTNEELTAPADAAWLVVNANMSNERSLKKIVHQAADFYTDSNNVEVTLSVDQPMIAAMDGPWIVLRYTTEPVATTVITTEQAVSLMQFSGSVYPVPEIAPHRTRVYQINTAFPRGEGAVFEELLGRECYLKDQYGNAIRGVISSIQKAQNRFYTVYTAALQQIEGDLA